MGVSRRHWIVLLASQLGFPAVAAAQDSSPAVRLQSFSIIVRDYDDAKRWYAEKLGFVVLRDQAFGQGERFVLVAPPGQADVGIVLQKAVRAPNSAEPEMATDYSDRIGKQVNIVLRAATVRQYADSLRARGVQLTSPLRNMPWGAQVTFVDLYGNTFVVVGPREPAG
jgi:catechol 2,3-dioxygenase-like lactoylglutathione lyase family enzyme